MGKLKLSNGAILPIQDYATQNYFAIILGSLTSVEVLATLTEENLTKIQFLTDKGAVTGTYYNKLLCNYIDNISTLAVRINDADLCRYGLVLDADNRIVDAPVQRYAPTDSIIVDKLPEGNLPDYLYINGKYVYDPLPKPEQPEPIEEPTVWDELDAAYQAGYTEGYQEGVNSAYDQ